MSRMWVVVGDDREEVAGPFASAADAAKFADAVNDGECYTYNAVPTELEDPEDVCAGWRDYKAPRTEPEKPAPTVNEALALIRSLPEFEKREIMDRIEKSLKK